jgi:DNA-binding response OmpR family regulator
MQASSETRTILVADDDDDIRTVVCTAVSTMGYTPLAATDGQHALDILKETIPDLAVLDVSMPGYTGIEVCHFIKSSETFKLTPIIMLTARDTIKDKVTALEGGADDYLTKPFHLHELQARIKALMRVRDLNQSLKEKNEELRATQEKLIERERQLLLVQFAGTAAHSLGQPLSAILLNCHLLENSSPQEHRYRKALEAIKNDAKRMVEMLEKLKSADASKTSEYYGKTEILQIKGKAGKP